MSRTLSVCVLLALSVSSLNLSAKETIEGQEDHLQGQATRKLLDEQAQGKNRGETEPYRAESAGKAYRAYVESIGQKAVEPQSQVNKN